MANDSSSAPRISSPATGVSVDALHLATAGVITAAAAFSQWATLASRYVEDIGRTAGDLGTGSTTPQGAARAALESLMGYARDMAELPRLSTLRFSSELARLKAQSGPR
jgi:hypothetical protein